MDGENNESDANAKEEAVGDEGAFNVLDDTDCRHANEANGFTTEPVNAVYFVVPSKSAEAPPVGKNYPNTTGISTET
ncbi:hypothetical protein HO133_005177 [Letharia lupina]|uniref:Uncharacterized protein n=1 Tax=Letharia lupina TaxID=560253 RepID=A0A8H6F8N4_9LECA|nr:uncharacterized protein HO133_005177 [Letharia lupina]KAF6219352.1 hypothetical protein HO133_005177 [Letharia lupina]